LRGFAEQAGSQERGESSKGTSDTNTEGEEKQNKSKDEADDKVDSEQSQAAAGEDGSQASASEESTKAEEEKELTPVERLQKELDEVTEKRGKKKRELLLALADFENNKKKLTKEREGRRSKASANFATSMVEVYREFEELPSLNAKIETDGEGNACAALQEGIALTRQLFASALEKSNIERIPVEIGQPVVKARHEVIGSVSGDGNQPKDSIAEVTDAGWIMDLRSSSPVVLEKAKVKTVGA
jgi:molecular chaperone GrpE